MQAQWCLVDRSRPKRRNGEDIGISSKRQRRVGSHLESPDECEDVPKIRGGLARPRPPQLGPPPNRATRTASEAQKTTATAKTNAPPQPTIPQPKTSQLKTPQSKIPQPKTPQKNIRIVSSDDEDDGDGDGNENWRPQPKQPVNTNQPGMGGVAKITGTSTTSGLPPGLTGIQGTSNPPNRPPQVGNTATKGPPQQPTPPSTGPSNQKQGTGTGAGNSTGGPGGTSSTTTTTAPTGALPHFPLESEILELYRKLQEMVVIWVEECLPDTFPLEFQTKKPERYWELCGWCRPVRLGDKMLAHRSWAKYVYESWVWRFLYEEIFRPESLTWAGYDIPTERGGAGGEGRATIDPFESLFGPSQNFMPGSQYQRSINNRAHVMDRIRNGLVTQTRYQLITKWLVTEMLVAFHPYFSDAYKPIDHAQNIEVLFRDTRFLIVKARELDEKLRSAQSVYDLILGRRGDVCRITGVESPAITRYDSRSPVILDDQSSIALIVVPGLVKYGIEESIYNEDDEVKKVVVRHARAFTRADVSEVMSP